MRVVQCRIEEAVRRFLKAPRLMNVRSFLFPIWLLLALPLVSAASLIACSSVGVRDAARFNAAGNRQYTAGNYPGALETYRRAEVLRPDLPALNYNAANTLNQQSDFPRAISESQQAVHSTDPAVQDHAYYSMANAFVRQNQLREAIDAYKSALRVNPSDVDAKYNLEVIQRKLDQFAQENPGQQGAQGSQAQQGAGQQAGQNEGQAGQGQQAAEAQNGQPQPGQAAGGQAGQSSASTGGSASGYTGTPEGQAAALDPALKRALAQFDQTGNVDDALRALDIAGQQERLEQAGSGGSAQPQGRDW